MHRILLKIGSYSIKCRDFQKVIDFRFTKEYHNVLYAIYTLFFTKNCPKYFDEIYVPLQTNEVHTRSSYQKLNVPHRKAIYLFVYLFIYLFFLLQRFCIRKDLQRIISLLSGPFIYI